MAVAWHRESRPRREMGGMGPGSAAAPRAVAVDPKVAVPLQMQLQQQQWT
eukprot:CAMPEP_0115353936 /NCGR_PEP_ID=MMETSP0270-20121206/98315_1 /TAXON_ID=71861 /ORGANISM="Scrippsiella trochoidea, Strain CCMP3099" /LENGTH=49 /DNA_ID= /DNA_START= /DNA_END= /DNA_ORIENTATION=